jgi:toxin ParE1/3/4
MAKMYSLRLSDLAGDDLDAIYSHGRSHWGELQADTYYDGLIRHFDQLCANPFLYSAVDDIRAGYRRSVYGAHSIYYRVHDEFIEVMAVIGKQDLSARL